MSNELQVGIDLTYAERVARAIETLGEVVHETDVPAYIRALAVNVAKLEKRLAIKIIECRDLRQDSTCYGKLDKALHDMDARIAERDEARHEVEALKARQRVALHSLSRIPEISGDNAERIWFKKGTKISLVAVNDLVSEAVEVLEYGLDDDPASTVHAIKDAREIEAKQQEIENLTDDLRILREVLAQARYESMPRAPSEEDQDRYVDVPLRLHEIIGSQCPECNGTWWYCAKEVKEAWDDLAFEIADMKQGIAERNCEAHKKNDTIESLGNALDKIEEDHKRLERQLHVVTQNRDDYDHEVARLEDELADSERERDAWRARTKELEDQKAALHQELEARTRAYQRVRAQLEKEEDDRDYAARVAGGNCVADDAEFMDDLQEMS